MRAARCVLPTRTTTSSGGGGGSGRSSLRGRARGRRGRGHTALRISKRLGGLREGRPAGRIGLEDQALRSRQTVELGRQQWQGGCRLDVQVLHADYSQVQCEVHARGKVEPDAHFVAYGDVRQVLEEDLQQVNIVGIGASDAQGLAVCVEGGCCDLCEHDGCFWEVDEEPGYGGCDLKELNSKCDSGLQRDRDSEFDVADVGLEGEVGEIDALSVDTERQYWLVSLGEFCIHAKVVSIGILTNL